MNDLNPLLSVAIPTFNRAEFLEVCLSHLVPQVEAHRDEVELIVCDNASEDRTAEVIRRFAERYPALKTLRNPQNVGSDRNIARCFRTASGRYVLIFGDDDVLMHGALDRILPVIRSGNHGAVFLRPLGYDANFLTERPPTLFKRPRVMNDPQRFIRKVHVYSTFISANVINKSLIADANTQQYIGTNLVQVYLFYQAVLRADTNVYIPEYLVAAKRNNSGGYNYLRVFVLNMNAALAALAEHGLTDATRRALNNRLIFRHLPYYALQMRGRGGEGFDADEAHALLAKHYARVPLYWICLYPILRLPLALARCWTWALILASRVAAGEFGRMVTFALSVVRSQGARS